MLMNGPFIAKLAMNGPFINIGSEEISGGGGNLVSRAGGGHAMRRLTVARP
jgi:hypothetical protein